MILPCRIHRAPNRVDSLSLALLFTASFLALQPGHTQGQNTTSIPLQITAGVDTGYDDHVIGSSATTSSSGAGSLFTRENVTLSYDRLGQRTELYLLGIGRFSQFFDLGTDDKDGNVTLSLTHNISTRLSLYASAYAAYQTEPDFSTNVGPENVRADHFYTNDIFSVIYYWLPRFATVTSYTFQRVKYAESTQASQDRLVNTLAEGLHYSLTRRTNLIGEYRFEITDYDTAPRDSVTHYALAGIDHHLTEHLILHVLGGESFRSFKDDGDKIDPYFEGWLAYASSNHSLKWTTSYGVEEPSAVTALVRTTIRTGLILTYGLTSRISSTAAVYYHHDDNEGSTSSGGFSSMGTQDSFDLTFGLRYTINKRFALHVDYAHTTLGSLGSSPGYSRNRYFGGLTYTY
jgi:Putative beta-barrel porin 2